jgi:hypothetical protein
MGVFGGAAMLAMFVFADIGRDQWWVALALLAGVTATVVALRWLAYAWTLARWKLWMKEVEAWEGRWRGWLTRTASVVNVSLFKPNHAKATSSTPASNAPDRGALSFPRSGASDAAHVVRGLFQRSAWALESLSPTIAVDVVIVASDADLTACEGMLRECWGGTTNLPRLGEVVCTADAGCQATLAPCIDRSSERPCWLVVLDASAGKTPAEGGAAFLFAEGGREPSLALSRPMRNPLAEWTQAVLAFAASAWSKPVDTQFWWTGWQAENAEITGALTSCHGMRRMVAIDADAVLGFGGRHAGWMVLAHACGVARTKPGRQVVAWMSGDDHVEWLVVAPQEHKNA